MDLSKPPDGWEKNPELLIPWANAIVGKANHDLREANEMLRESIESENNAQESLKKAIEETKLSEKYWNGTGINSIAFYAAFFVSGLFVGLLIGS